MPQENEEEKIEGSEEKKPDSQQEQMNMLLGQLKDPLYMKAQLEAAGYKVDSKKEEESKDEVLEIPELKLPEGKDVELADVVKAFNESLAKLAKGLDGKISKTVQNVDKKQSEKEIAREAQQIREFAATKKDFNEPDMLAEIKLQWAAGIRPIEKCYDKARILTGKGEQKKEEKSERTTSSIKTEENEDGVKKKFKGIKSAAQNVFDELKKQHGSNLLSNEG